MTLPESGASGGPAAPRGRTDRPVCVRADGAGPGVTLAALLALAWPAAAPAQEIAPRDGWETASTEKSFDTLLADLRDAVAANGMGVVTQAGPTETAAARGIRVPGNRVVGVFNNDFAVRLLDLSVPAMIEAPIRFYVTEDPDGTATLSYKTPGFVLAPYLADAPGIAPIADELDARFAAIARAATSKD